MRSPFAIVVCLAVTAWNPSAFSQSQVFEHRSQGLIHDGFMSADGNHLWTSEDGGRIRYRNPGGVWTYQPVDEFVKDTIHRIHFLDDNSIGWAVAQDGSVLKTTNAGGPGWQIINTIPSLVPNIQYEDLFDVHFLDQNRGWVLGLHAIWYTTDGGANWLPATLLDAAGGAVSLEKVELYSIDAIERGSSLLVLACGTPGWVFRNVDAAGTVLQVVWDVANYPAQDLPGCEIGAHSGAFAAWDLEISRTGGIEDRFALMVGGVDLGCGLIFSSVDDGLTWTKERHECQPAGGGNPCAGNPLYNNDPTTLLDTWRWQNFRALYGLGLFGDRSAVASGYNGQHLVRSPSTGTWGDRSRFSNKPFDAVDPIYMPFYGAVAARGGTATNGKAQLMGVSGLLRGTTDGGATWQHDLVAEQWRTTAAHFHDATTGWYASQLFRIAKTTDGGLNWTPQSSNGEVNTRAFKAITFDATGQWGVAVGDYDPRMLAAFPDRPKIMHNDSQGPLPDLWSDPLAIRVEGNTNWTQKELRAVVSSGGQTFWTAGQAGLVFFSDDAGVSWKQAFDAAVGVQPFQEYEFEGLDFMDATHGIFVGWKTTSPGGKAFWYDDGTWTNISPADPQIWRINDVKILGNSAYAVAEKIDSNNFHQGVVLKSDYSGSAFGPFQALPPVDQVPAFACKAGGDLGRIPILNCIEANPSNGEIWVGGECGRIWRGTTAPITWTQEKSQSDSHVQSMSMTPQGYLYLGMSRLSTTQQAIVRWHP